MNKETFKTALVADIKRRDWYTFKNVVDFAEEHGIPTRGEFAIGQLHLNVLYWVNLSDELSEIVEDLIKEKQLFYHPADYLTYLIDGCALQMPIMKRMPPKGGYKTPHWLPLCLRGVPMKE